MAYVSRNAIVGVSLFLHWRRAAHADAPSGDVIREPSKSKPPGAWANGSSVLAVVGICALFSGCSTDQVNQLKQSVAAMTPSQTYTFVRGGKSYQFTTHKTTYNEVLTQLGTPTKSGTLADGSNFLMYRAVSDPDTSNRHDYTKYLSYLSIREATFTFDKESRLLSARDEDKTTDPVVKKEVQDQERQAQGSAATVNAQRAAATPPTMDMQTRFEMALIEENGNYRCGWPLSQKEKTRADERIKEFGAHMNRLDYQVQINRGMSLGEHQSNADFCLDEKERKKFDGAVRYLAG